MAQSSTVFGTDKKAGGIVSRGGHGRREWPTANVPLVRVGDQGFQSLVRHVGIESKDCRLMLVQHFDDLRRVTCHLGASVVAVLWSYLCRVQSANGLHIGNAAG